MTMIHVARDGLVVIGDPIVTKYSPHEAWCDSVRDALVQRRWQDVYRMLEKHNEDELCEAPNELIAYTLPLVECDDKQQAKRLIVRFCKRGIGSHPLLALAERWYYIPNFNDTIDDVFKWQTTFQRYLDEESQKANPSAVSPTQRRNRSPASQRKRALDQRRR